MTAMLMGWKHQLVGDVAKDTCILKLRVEFPQFPCANIQKTYSSKLRKETQSSTTSIFEVGQHVLEAIQD